MYLSISNFISGRQLLEEMQKPFPSMSDLNLTRNDAEPSSYDAIEEDPFNQGIDPNDLDLTDDEGKLISTFHE